VAVYDETGAYATAHENAAPMNPQRSGPLRDVRIVDLTRALAGPYATMILADMGADVIKVEAPGGDGLRQIGPHTEADDEHLFGGYFASCNRNKRAIVLDLKNSERDRETLLRKLVYGAIRGFGDPRFGEGPYTNWPAFDIVAQSMGGLVSHTGTIDGLWELLSKGWGYMTAGRQWIQFKETFGLVGTIKAVEVTHGGNGWHPHIHVLFFVDAPMNDFDRDDAYRQLTIGRPCAKRWQDQT